MMAYLMALLPLRAWPVSCLLASILGLGLISASPARAELKVGAAKVDVTPIQLPVLVNGGMLSRSVDQIKSRLHARAIVLDDQEERLAIVVVDSCMLPRPLLDEAKQLASQRTKIAVNRMMISATHTHTAPSAMACLGTEVDPTYVPYLREKIAEAIATAESRLEPAEVGWGVDSAADFTALRRWIRRPDRIEQDPFGNPTVRANMHAGRVWDDVIGESGPKDPDLSLIAFRSSVSGKPLAVLANFSMHYFGDQHISADYFGLFCDGLERRVSGASSKTPHGDRDAGNRGDGDAERNGGGKTEQDEGAPSDQADGQADVSPAKSTAKSTGSEQLPASGESPQSLESRSVADRGGEGEFVAILSHGCSGDIWRRDYTKPAESTVEPTLESYTQGLLEIALGTFQGISYELDADLAMAEARMTLRYRVPDQQHLEWARRIVDEMGDRPPRDTREVYAREQLYLHEKAATEVVVQAIRIGKVAIATTPNETYALTGLKLKHQSPLEQTMVIELANGGDGYIPPPEQHLLGGYNTWPARSAGLEIEAEPKIAEAAVGLLETVTGLPRRTFQQSRGVAVEAILAAQPVAYWRLDEWAGPRAIDASGRGQDGIYEPGVVFFLEGPEHRGRFTQGGELNRAAHFAGGRLDARIADLGDDYTVSLWCWNGMPLDGRDIAGWMFSRGHDFGLDQGAGPEGDHLGLGGISHSGKVVFLPGTEENPAEPLVGTTELARWTWNHVVLVREGDRVRVHVNGERNPEIEAVAPRTLRRPTERLFFGGRCDHQDNWEGRLDEIALFDRALSPSEVSRLYSPATRPSSP
jgi:hypothetical protein